MKKYIISLDQGTTSSRAIIFDHEQNIVEIAQKEFQQIYPKPGYVEHDPMEGRQVGLLDVDVHGPSIPRLLKLTGSHPGTEGGKLLPVEWDWNLAVMEPWSPSPAVRSNLG